MVSMPLRSAQFALAVHRAGHGPHLIRWSILPTCQSHQTDAMPCYAMPCHATPCRTSRAVPLSWSHATFARACHRYALFKAPAAVTLVPGRNDVLLVGTPRFSGKLRPSELSVDIGRIRLSQYALPAFVLAVLPGKPVLAIAFPQKDTPLLASVQNR